MSNSISRITNEKKNKKNSFNNNVYKYILYTMSFVIIFVLLSSFIMMIIEGIQVASENNLSFFDMMFGNEYVPGTGVLSVGFIIFNTLWMSFLALLIAVPVALSTSIFITRILKKNSAMFMFAIVSILAAIPSVIYGAFGYYVLNSALSSFEFIDDGSLLVIIIMIALMIMPTITLMTITSINMVDKKLEDSSYALGATKTQTSIFITLRSAKTGIIMGILFALGRAIGEATAISMVGSPNSFLDGVVISPWKQSLFLSPAILTITSTETPAPFPVYLVLSSVLLLTILIVFAIAKYTEYATSDKIKANKQSKISYKNRSILKKYNKDGFESLEPHEQQFIIKTKINNDKTSKTEDTMSYKFKKNTDILKKSTLYSSFYYEAFKKSKTKKHNSTIAFFSMLGIALLVSIFWFLFNGGFEFFNWDTFSTRGVKTVYDTNGDSTKIYGLAVPIMGTLITVLVSMSIALPIGVSLGICFATYVDPHTKTGRFISLVFQIVTSIPAVIYGSVAILIFSGTHIDKELKAFEPMLMLSIVVLPTILKQTEEGASKVKQNQIDGSIALGATVLTTTRKIYLKEIMPAIISAALLSTSIIIADSAIFITILPMNNTEDVGEWVEKGGFTLSTTIFYLKMENAITTPEALLQIKTIGILLMFIILVLSISSVFIKDKQYYQALILLIALILLPLSFYINPNEGLKWLAITSIVLICVGVFVVPLARKGKEIYGNKRYIL